MNFLKPCQVQRWWKSRLDHKSLFGSLLFVQQLCKEKRTFVKITVSYPLICDMFKCESWCCAHFKIENFKLDLFISIFIVYVLRLARPNFGALKLLKKHVCTRLEMMDFTEFFYIICATLQHVQDWGWSDFELRRSSCGLFSQEISYLDVTWAWKGF